jgi:hypothetical protein
MFSNSLRRRLGLEPLEKRLLLATIEGTVFADLDADGIQNGEDGLADWTVVLDRTDTPEPMLTLLNPSPDPNDGFGSAVIATADRIVVGARYDDTDAANGGMAYVFDLAGNLLHTLHNPTPNAGDEFGWHFAVNGDILLVGVNLDDTGAEHTYLTWQGICCTLCTTPHLMPVTSLGGTLP